MTARQTAIVAFVCFSLMAVLTAGALIANNLPHRCYVPSESRPK